MKDLVEKLTALFPVFNLVAWVFLCLFLKKFEIGQCFSPFPPEAQSSVAGLHSGRGSTNICSSWVPSAPFLCPSGAGGIIKLLLFILHSIFVSDLCH